MLGAKQRNHRHHFNVFGLTRPLSGIEPWISRNEVGKSGGVISMKMFQERTVK